jgi:hypothetical protein
MSETQLNIYICIIKCLLAMMAFVFLVETGIQSTGMSEKPAEASLLSACRGAELQPFTSYKS